LAFLGGVGALELLERKPELLARHGLNALGRLSPSLNAALLILGLVILSLAFYGWHLWRRHSARVGTLTAWMFLVLYLVGGAVVFRVVDPTQNLHWMTADLRKIGAFTPALGAFRMDETTRCIVPYDTGVYLKHQDTPEALRQFVRENPSAKLLMLERNMGYVPEDIGRRLQLIRRWPYNNRRVYGLYRIGPAMPEDAGARQP
jgi:hypothetical protein